MIESKIQSRPVFAACFALVLLAAGALAQEKPKPAPGSVPEELQQITHAKVTVVFNEYQGEKKVSSLPYVLQVNAYPHGGHEVSLRMGLRVPVPLRFGSQTSYSYQDLGTDIDCMLQPRSDGAYLLDLSAVRNTIYAPESSKGFIEWHLGDEPLSGMPVTNTLHVNPKLIIRDGHTEDAATVTDPVSGHVVKIAVTLNVENE